MKGKSYSTEERIYILETVDAGGDIKEVCQENKIAEQTLRRWKRQLGCADVSETLRREEQEHKNSELKKILVDSLLVNQVLDAVYRKDPSLNKRRPKRVASLTKK
jgi:transposase-like protein